MQQQPPPNWQSAPTGWAPQPPPKRSRTPLYVALALAAALVLLALGLGASWFLASSEKQPAAVPSATSTQPPADGGSFTDPRTIVEKAQGTLSCADIKQDKPSGALLQYRCDEGNTVIRTYADHSGVSAQIEVHKLGGGDLLTGQNWTINADPAILKAAHVYLGGELVHIPCEDVCS